MKRSRRDSNPRCLSTQRFSRPLPKVEQTPTESGLTKTAKNDLAGNLALFPDLAAVAEAWPSLPEHVQRTILHVVRASDKPEDH